MGRLLWIMPVGSMYVSFKERQREISHTERRRQCDQRQRLKQCSRKPRNDSSYLEEARTP